MLASTDTSLSTCEKGINFDGGDISVSNSITPSGNQILAARRQHLPRQADEQHGRQRSSGGILARFRIADWNTSSHASAIWRPITSCASATGSGPDIGNGSDFDLTCSWTLSAAEQCEYDVPSGRPDGCAPATKDDHQCILVDLRTASSQFYFSSASAYRNHNFVGASEYRKKVRVDVNNLPAFAGPDPNRDVYVYIQTQNMPAQVSPGGGGKPDPSRGGGEAGRSALLKRLEIPGDGRIGSAESARIQKALAAGQITFDQVSRADADPRCVRLARHRQEAEGGRRRPQAAAPAVVVRLLRLARRRSDRLGEQAQGSTVPRSARASTRSPCPRTASSTPRP